MAENKIKIKIYVDEAALGDYTKELTKDIESGNIELDEAKAIAMTDLDRFVCLKVNR